MYWKLIYEKEKTFLLSGSTDGRILMWEISSYITQWKKEQLAVEINHPLFEISSAHQSGVNSITTCQFSQLHKENSNNQNREKDRDDLLLFKQQLRENEVIVCSSGDDQSIYISLLSISPGNIEENNIIDNNNNNNNIDNSQFIIIEEQKVKLKDVHSASVTTVKVIDNLIFSSGPDIRLLVWQIFISNDENNLRKLEVRRKEGICVDVSDVSSLDVIKISS